jgi:hypothetical protein
MSTTAIKEIPAPEADETDAAYMARLKAMGITEEDFEDAFLADFPLSESDVTTTIFYDGDDENRSNLA